MTSREQFFNDLRKLIISAESNLKYGRKRIGEKKLMNAYKLLGSYGEPSLRDEGLTRKEKLEAVELWCETHIPEWNRMQDWVELRLLRISSLELLDLKKILGSKD